MPPLGRGIVNLTGGRYLRWQFSGGDVRMGSNVRSRRRSASCSLAGAALKQLLRVATPSSSIHPSVHAVLTATPTPPYRVRSVGASVIGASRLNYDAAADDDDACSVVPVNLAHPTTPPHASTSRAAYTNRGYCHFQESSTEIQQQITR